MMANKKIECPECEGDGRDWDEDRGNWGNDDCPVCEGEGEIDDD